jgi:RNase P subunit RPR2
VQEPQDFCVAPASGISYNRETRGLKFIAPLWIRSLVLTTKEETRVALTCPSCGNDQNFLVKTLQMHLVHLEDSRVDVSEEGKPGVLEVLCDECETALNFDEVDEAVRRELRLTLGAR